MKYIQIFIIFTILLGWSSCSEKKEGCLDIKATNYDVSADKDCCCVYPNLDLIVSHKFDDLSFRLGDNYAFDGMDTFKVNEFRMLFSEIHPSSNGVEVLVEDTIHINIDNNGIVDQLEIEDNFVVIKPNRFEYSIGTFPFPGTYDNLGMNFGLEGNLNLVVPDSVFKEGHPLESEEDSIWSLNNGYFYLYMDVTPNVFDSSIANKEILIRGEANQFEISQNIELIAPVGFDFDINITIDYKTLFNGLDFVADDETTLSAGILQNIPLSIDVIE